MTEADEVCEVCGNPTWTVALPGRRRLCAAHEFGNAGHIEKSPPAPPTPEGLAAALALIDEGVRGGNERDRAVFAVARAAVAWEIAEAETWRGRPYAEGFETLADCDARRNEVMAGKRAAVARLVALATGAKAGEGAGG